jgi:phage terminase large subunit-like protein
MGGRPKPPPIRRARTVRGWLMSWAVANADVEPKGNAIIITEHACGTAKIDPLMTAFNGIELMSMNPWSTRPSIFMI